MEEQFSQIEAAIITSQSGLESAQEALDFLSVVEMEETGLNWAISRITQLQNVSQIKRALIFITHWIKNKWDLIPAESIETIREVLFASPYIDTYYSDLSFRNIISDAEVSFMWKMYPDNWPSFWEDIGQSFSPQKILSFLLAFDSYSRNLDPLNHEVYNKIKNGMRADHADEAIATFAISQLDPKIKETFTVYGFLLTWVNRDYVVKEDALKIVNDAMAESETAVISLQVFRKIIERGMPEEEKMQLISFLAISDHVASVLESFGEDESIVVEAAMLLNSTGKQIIHTELLETYLTLAMQFLMNDSNEASYEITQFINLSIKGHPEICLEIAQNVYNRLVYYFESNSSYNNVFPNKLVEIIGRCLRTNQEEVLPFILSSFATADTIQDTCACLDICCFSFKENKCEEATKAAVEQFSSILSLTEVENDQQLTAIILFGSFFASVSLSFDEETVGTVFVGVLAFATNTELPEEFHDEIGSILLQLTRNPAVVQPVEPSTMLELIQTFDSPILATVAKLVSYLEGSTQDETLGSCIGIFQQAIQDAGDEEKISIIKQTLVFIRAVISERVPNFVQYVQEFLLSLHDLAVQDDETFGVYISTIVSTLNFASLEFVLQMVEEINGVHSLSAIAEAFHILAKGDNKEWCLEGMCAIKGLVIEEYLKESHWETENSTRTIVIQLLDSFIRFATIAVQEVIIDDELRSFIIETMLARFDTPTILCNLIEFAIKAAAVKPELVTDMALPSMSFLFCPKFDHLQVQWKAVIRLTAEFHRVLFTSGFDEVVGSALSDVGATSEMYEEYVATFSLPEQKRGKAAIEFFGKLNEYRKANQM